MVKEEARSIEIARIVIDVNRYDEQDGAITIIPAIGDALVFDKLNVSDLIKACADMAASKEEGMSTSIIEEKPQEVEVIEAPAEPATEVAEEVAVETSPAEDTAPAEDVIEDEPIVDLDEEAEAPEATEAE